MVHELSPLATLFAQHRERPWLFVRPGGNWGDYLIYAGAEKLAREVGLTWTSCDSDSFARQPTTSEHAIYLHGSGGYNSWCSGRPFDDLAQAAGRRVALVVQGPQSCEDAPERLAGRFEQALTDRLCTELVLFAREHTTLAVLQALPLAEHGATLALDHDTALALAADDLAALAGLARIPRGRYALTVFREDQERRAPAAHVPPTRGVVLDPAIAADSFVHWLRIHLYCRSVATNRLHSAIVCSLAGKPVALGPGAYHKNRSVWEYSLQPRGARWVEDIVPAPSPWWNRLPQRLRDSYKLRQLRFALQGLPTR